MFAILLEKEKPRGVECASAYLAGVKFFVAKTNTTGMRAAPRLRKAAKLIRRAGISRCVFPEGFQQNEIFLRVGIEPVDTAPLYLAAAPAITEAALTKKGICLRDASVAIAGDGSWAEETLAATAAKVRSASIYSLHGCERLCEKLRRESGVSVRIIEPRDTECTCDALVTFGDSPVKGNACAVWIKAGKPPGTGVCADNEPRKILFEDIEETRDDETLSLDKDQLISALIQAGALDARSFKVKDIRFLLDIE